MLLIPVGGFYTIDAITAKNVVKNLNPSIVFPMHYKTKAIDFPIAAKESYLDLIESHRKIDSNKMILYEENFTSQQTIILNYK